MSLIAVVGAGPAGLMAAEQLAKIGHSVTVLDQMPSIARKFLLAGRGGLNLTHTDDMAEFLTRYGAAADWMSTALSMFPPAALRAWCEELGQPVFTGTSGRVFPCTMKTSPLLRAWHSRLRELGVRFSTRHRWCGWDDTTQPCFDTPNERATVQADALLLAMGGASWPRMGSDGGWVPILARHGVRIAPLRASNCGIRIAWSENFRTRFGGVPLKRVALSCDGRRVRGEAMVTADGLEGGAVYALSRMIRTMLDVGEHALLYLDLRPDMTQAALAARLDGARRGRSLSNFLRQQAGLSPVAIGLVHEVAQGGTSLHPLSSLIKQIPLTVEAMQPITRSISSAGGIDLDELDEHMMIKRLPGVFAAGEMLDWEAPTGGYLLQACFSTGVLAAHGIHSWLTSRPGSARNANSPRPQIESHI